MRTVCVCQVLTTAQRLTKEAGAASGSGGRVPLSSCYPSFSLLIPPPWPPPLSLPSSSFSTLVLRLAPHLACIIGILSARFLPSAFRHETDHIPAIHSLSWLHVNRQRRLLLLASGGSALLSLKCNWSFPDEANTGSVPTKAGHRAGHQPYTSSVGTGTK